MRWLVAAAFVITAVVARADDERVLIPVSTAGPESYGEHWRTVVAIDNRSDHFISTSGVTFDIHCAIPEGCIGDALWPKSLGYIVSPPSLGGLVLRIPKSAANEVFFSARVAAAPRLVRYGGSELPVARESAFRRDLIALVQVPIRAEHPHTMRTHLRIYTLNEGGATVRVRVSASPLISPYFDELLTLHRQQPPAAPGYLFVELENTTLPSLTASVATVYIEPQPRSDGTVPLVWAFATAVASGSEEVTVVTSQ